MCSRRARTIADFSGVRFSNKIGANIERIHRRLEDGLWDELIRQMSRLTDSPGRNVEIEVADFVHDSLDGFGPKQARNFLKGLGLTRYEIPINSRVSRWLRHFGFPAALTPAALSDRAYYGFVSDAVVELCEKSDVFPCIRDAAIFSSFDDGQ